MDYRHNPRASSSAHFNSDCLRAILSSPASIQTLKRDARTILKRIAIPFATISVATLTGLTNSAYAASTDNSVPASSFLKDHIIPAPITQLADTINKGFDWIHNLPQEIGKLSVELMAWIYELCADLILKTPIWLFANEWFSNTTLLFSAIAIGLVSVLTLIESMKPMLSGFRKSRVIKMSQPMDFKVIAKRWFFVAGTLTAVPFIFQKAFQGLNSISDFIVHLGADNMRNLTLGHVTEFDALTMLIFDVILVGTAIPVLLQNGRRFFDLLVLGVTTPLALTAWIFDPYKHLFQQWWTQVKNLSLVQVYYAIFLLVLGWFIFGVGTPVTFGGLLTKTLVCIGGFYRLASPPQIISRKLDSGKGLDDTVKNNVKDTIKKTTKNYELIKSTFGGPMKVVKAIMKK